MIGGAGGASGRPGRRRGARGAKRGDGCGTLEHGGVDDVFNLTRASTARFRRLARDGMAARKSPVMDLTRFRPREVGVRRRGPFPGRPTPTWARFQVRRRRLWQSCRSPVSDLVRVGGPPSPTWRVLPSGVGWGRSLLRTSLCSLLGPISSDFWRKRASSSANRPEFQSQNQIHGQ